MKIKVTPNYKKKTFTIRKYDHKNRITTKYRTNQFTMDEFEELQYNTNKDWIDFLNNSNHYHVVYKIPLDIF
jgi:2-polyprenyl-3-methyl-5-hydroxy-6-metoxy-1,4-benzoquinol methylase